MPWYLDTSAFLKLAIEEDRSERMRAWTRREETDGGGLWSSDLLVTEASRAARRVSSEALEAVRDRLERVSLIAITQEVFRQAGELDPAVLRSLDAIHIAAARSLGDDLEGIVTYDERMTTSAGSLGLPVVAP